MELSLFLLKKDLSHVVKKQINTQYEMWDPNKKNFTEKFHGQGKFGRTRWDTVFKTDSVSHFFCFITCKVKLMLSQIQVLKDYELLVVYVTKITTTLMLLLQILQSI